MEKSEFIKKTINLLENAKKRPAMFFPYDISGLQGFISALHGIYWGVFDVEPNESVTNQVLEARGVKKNALGYWIDFEQRNLSFEQIIEESISIEIETLKKL